ncbi:hypothetical protein GH733_012676 [Mirounga leonina]|nr:hypothetical protein GH733_012676 [Mirounga leonina]
MVPERSGSPCLPVNGTGKGWQVEARGAVLSEILAGCRELLMPIEGGIGEWQDKKLQRQARFPGLLLHPDRFVSMAPPSVKCRLLGLYPEASSQDAEGHTKEVGLPSLEGQEKVIRWVEDTVDNNDEVVSIKYASWKSQDSPRPRVSSLAEWPRRKVAGALVHHFQRLPRPDLDLNVSMNTYLFMMQAQGILIRDNMRTIGAQVYEQVVRSAYAKRNSSMNDSDYPLDLNHSETFLQTTTFLPEDFTYFANHTCPERLPSMKGPIDINMSEIAMDDIHEIFSKDPAIKLGGHWKPSDCMPRWKVAILIPFRNRHEHLPVLLRHLIPMLQRQRLRFAVYVVEQVGTQPFNRAMLFNVGFQEAMKDLDWDCLIFHDVDHIPESDRNYYGCGQMPRHFATKLDKLPYAEFFGGVSGLTVEQFRKINGFPNAFWGWGGEDDDLWNRVQNAGYSVSRPEGDTGKYKSIPHHHRGEVQFLGRYALLRKSKERQGLDGLNNLNYFANITYDALYKNITVNLTPELAQVTDVPSQPGSPEQELTSAVGPGFEPVPTNGLWSFSAFRAKRHPTTGLF